MASSKMQPCVEVVVLLLLLLVRSNPPNPRVQAATTTTSSLLRPVSEPLESSNGPPAPPAPCNACFNEIM